MDGWQAPSLGEVCQIKPPKKEAKASLAPTDPVSFVPMDQLGIGTKSIALNGERPLGEVYGSYTYFADNDVLLAKITPCFENGKLGIARGLTNGVGFGSSEFIVFRCGPTVDPEYLYYFLSQPGFRVEGARVMTGAVGHKRVPNDFIDEHAIPLPQLYEQKRIVAILDEAFEGIGRAVANAEKNLANARELFEGYLNAVFVERADWSRFPLKQLTKKIGSGATPRGGSESYKDKGISLYRSLNVHDRRFKVAKLAFLDDAQAALLSNVTVEQGDVLFNITGASIARCCIAPVENLPARVNQHVAILRPIPERLSTEFLCYLMTSRPYKETLLGIGIEGGSTRQAITKKQLEELVVSIPESVSEQRSVAAELDAISSETAKLENLYRSKLSALADLKQSILQRAFAGDLTKQPNRTLAMAGA